MSKNQSNRIKSGKINSMHNFKHKFQGIAALQLFKKLMRSVQ